MRVALRYLFHVTAALSLILFCATASLWVRSYWRNDYYKPASRQACYFTQPGALWMTLADRPYRTRPGYSSERANGVFDQQNRSWAFAGAASTNGYAGHSYRGLGFACFWFTQTNYSPPCRFTYVGIPMWGLAIVTATAPAVWLRRRLAVAIPAGHCKRCGYDLRASPDRCPECGSPAAPADAVRRALAALAARLRPRAPLVTAATSG